MGRIPGGYITVTKASSILQCDTEKIHSLCEHGLLRRIHDGNRVLINSEDVADIHRLNLAGEIRPGELLRRVLFLERRVQRLDAAVSVLFEANNMSASKFSQMNDNDLVSLYNNLYEELGEEEWPRERLFSYAEIFIKITEIEIDRLNDLLNTDHSWATFYQLLLKISRHIGEHPALKTDLELQQIRNYFAVGRQNLATIAVLFAERAVQSGPARHLMERLASNSIDIFDDLAKQMQREKDSGKSNPRRKRSAKNKNAKLDI